MAEPGPTEVAASGQGALREEDDVWAVEDGGESRVLSEPVLAAAGRALRPSLLLPCACSLTTAGRARMLLDTHKAAVYTPGGGSGAVGAKRLSPPWSAITCSKSPPPRFTLKTLRGDGSVSPGTWTRKESRCEMRSPCRQEMIQGGRQPSPAASKQTGEPSRAGEPGSMEPEVCISDGCYHVNQLAGAMPGDFAKTRR